MDVHDPHVWLKYARSDLVLAGIGPAGPILAVTLCFHAQQAAEKALKAILVSHGMEVPYTHDIKYLLETLPVVATPPPAVQAAAELTYYAVLSRYPTGSPDVSLADYQAALQLAHAVVAWAEAQIP